MTSWDESDRRHLADLVRAHDRMMAEHAEWNAKRERAAASQVRKSEADGLLHREIENSEPAPAPQPDAKPSDADLSHDLDLLAEATDKFSEACDHRFDRLEREIEFLRGQVAALLAITGASNKAMSVDDDRVVDLPRGFIRRRSDAA